MAIDFNMVSAQCLWEQLSSDICLVFSLTAACSCPAWPLITPLQTMPSQHVLLMGLWSVALVLVNTTFLCLWDSFSQSIIFRVYCFFFFLASFINVNVSQHELFHCYFSIFTLGERLFPPPSGLSYSSWFCIEHFSSPPNNHPVRLLTVVRRANSSEQHYVCLAVVLSAKDRSLIVSTKEELLQNYGQDLSFFLLLVISKNIKRYFHIHF